MNRRIVIVTILCLAVLPPALLAQSHNDSLRGPRSERLDQYRKMRLVEELKLSEEDAVRFFSKQSAHEDKIHAIMKSRNDALDQIDKLLQGKNDNGDLQKLTADVLTKDQEIFQERQRWQEELRKFLPPEKFGKYLVFERNFGRQVRDAMEEVHGERREH
jgi:hypothetical protein